MTSTMEERWATMRERLASTPRKTSTKVSVAEDVRALRDIIRTQRRAGKTWEQIANDMYGDSRHPSAVRTAYNRLKKRSGSAPEKTPNAKPSGSAARRSSGAMEAATSSSPPQITTGHPASPSDMFGAMPSPTRSVSEAKRS